MAPSGNTGLLFCGLGVYTPPPCEHWDVCQLKESTGGAEGQKYVTAGRGGGTGGEPQRKGTGLWLWRARPSLRRGLGWGAAGVSQSDSRSGAPDLGSRGGSHETSAGNTGGAFLHTAWVAPTDPQRRLPPGTWQGEGRAGGGTETSPLCPSDPDSTRAGPGVPHAGNPPAGPKGEFQNFL